MIFKNPKETYESIVELGLLKQEKVLFQSLPKIL